MKAYITIVLFALLPGYLFSQGINFENGTFNSALEKARKENKVLFIDAWATWCAPCKHMDNTTFKDPRVGEVFKKNLIAFKIDVERGEGPALKIKYAIEGLPGYVFFDGDGNVIFRSKGAMGVDPFLNVVQQALDNAKDTNSLRSYVERYSSESTNEVFLKKYLDKLYASKSSNYSQVLEDYLKVQRSIEPSSRRMAQLLADHYSQIIYDGVADKIITENMNSPEWRLQVRKKVRETYQKIPQSMLQASLEHAITTRDSSMLEVILRRGDEANLIEGGELQRKKLHKFYYERTGMGEQFKKLLYDEADKFTRELDTSILRQDYLRVMNNKKNHTAAENERKITPHAVGKSKMLQEYAISYSKFAITNIEKEHAIKWARIAAYITPDDPYALSVYADLLYTFNSNQQEALRIKAQAVSIIRKENLGRSGMIESNYELMKSGKPIIL